MPPRAADSTQVAPGTPVVDRERCKGCGLCVEFCPFGHLRLDEELNVAGYHPALPERAEEAAAGLDPDPRRPEEPGRAAEGFEHNFAYWCLRCRYCEIVCPDAAVRLAGGVDGLEGTRGSESEDGPGPEEGGGAGGAGGEERGGLPGGGAGKGSGRHA